MYLGNTVCNVCATAVAQLQPQLQQFQCPVVLCCVFMYFKLNGIDAFA
jgi:hypothetical protein